VWTLVALRAPSNRHKNVLTLARLMPCLFTPVHTRPGIRCHCLPLSSYLSLQMQRAQGHIPRPREISALRMERKAIYPQAGPSPSADRLATTEPYGATASASPAKDAPFFIVRLTFRDGATPTWCKQ
jgi:hypothetical protein